MDDTEIIAEFLVESHENLDQLDRDLVALERQPESRELLSSIFRTIHTIKGTSGFLALHRLESLTHVGENLLSKLRDGQLELTQSRTGRLLDMVDAVRALLATLEETGSDEGGTTDVDAVVAALKAELEPTAAPAPDAAPATPPVVAPVASPAAAPLRLPPPAAPAAAPTRGRLGPPPGAAPALTPEPPPPAAPIPAVPAPTAASLTMLAPPLTAPLTPAQLPGFGAVTEQAVPEQAVPDEQPSVAESPVEPESVEPQSAPVEPEQAAPEPAEPAEPAADEVTAPAEAAPETLETAEPATPPAPAAAQEQPVTARSAVVDQTVRVDVTLLDGLVQLVGELVLTRNQVLQCTESMADTELVRAAQRLDLVASELQEGIMKTRMQPIGQVWAKMPRIVRDLSLQLGRTVDLHMDGHETELDRSLLEALSGPLTHLVRNSLDHGIEPPEQRLAAGKSEAGHLSLRAFHESGQVVVEISDDGRGIDPVKIGQVALSRGVVTAEGLARMDHREIVALVYRAGFSTATEVSNVSGRGVGMDVVRTNIEQIGGSVDLQSDVGLGTTVRVRIPLTLAIIPALLVGQGEERYVIPQANLVELVRVDAEERLKQVADLAGAPVLRLRGRLLPLVDLGRVLSTPPRSEGDGSLTVVVVQADGVRFGLCVEAVHDTQEVVVKPIGRQLKELAMYAGATVMGDGRVALILDIPGLAREESVGAVHEEPEAETRVAAADTTSLLILEISDGRRAALPLASVTRLEEVSSAQVEHSGLTEVMQYRGDILPLVRLASAIGLRDTAAELDTRPVVVHEMDGRRMGIVIDRVIDVVEETLALRPVGRRPGVLGSAVIADRVTELVDLDAVMATVRRVP